MNTAKYAVFLLTAALVLFTSALAQSPAGAAGDAPLSQDQVVTLFHETYGTADMDRIGPYTTANFRDGTPVSVWVYDVWHDLDELAYEPLEFNILESRLSDSKDRAQVVCSATFKTIEGTTTQKEIYLLIRQDDRWLIDDLIVTDEKFTEPEIAV